MVFGEDFNRGKTYLLCLTLIRKKPTWFRCILFDAIVMGEKSKSHFSTQNFIGQNFIGQNFIGQNFIGQNFIGQKIDAHLDVHFST